MADLHGWKIIQPKPVETQNSIPLGAVSLSQPKLTCDECNNWGKNKYLTEKVVGHFYEKHNLCKECHIPFTTRTLAIDHFETKHGKKGRCQFCKFYSFHHGDLVDHLTKMHQQMGTNPKDFLTYRQTDKVFHCDRCNLPIKGNIRALKTHLLSEHYYCADCKFGCSEQWKAIDHMINEHPKVKIRCDYCENLCLDPFKLKCHENKHKMDEDSPSLALLAQRANNKTPNVVSMQDLKKPLVKTIFVGNKSPSDHGYTSSTVVSLQELKKPAAAKTKKNHSPDQMALKCLGCSFSTHDEKAMRNHEIGAHGAKIPSKCSGCNFSTDDQQAMKEHEIKSHGPKSKKLRLNCSHQNCETTTADPKAMIEHEKRAHGGAKPGQKRKYSSIQSVIKCDLCTFYTEEQRFMDMHKAGAHGNKKLPEYEKILGMGGIPKSIVPATLKCTDCTFKTKDKKLMITHRNEFHPKSDDEKCSECVFTSKYKEILQMHRKNAHGISSIAESPKEIVLLMNPDNLLEIKKEPLEPNEDPFANLPDPLEINETMEKDKVTSKEILHPKKGRIEILEKQKSTYEEWKKKKQIYIEKDELTSKEFLNATKSKTEILEEQKSFYEKWKMEKQIYSNQKIVQKPTNKRKLNESVESGSLILNFKHTKDKEQTFGENAEKETTSLSPPSKRSKQNRAETIEIKKEPEEIAPELEEAISDDTEGSDFPSPFHDLESDIKLELEIEENLLAESGSENEPSEKISMTVPSEIISVKDEAIIDSPDEYESYDFKQSSNEDQSDDDVEVHDVMDAEWKEYGELLAHHLSLRKGL